MGAARDTRIDTMRGLACILLVAFHVIGDTGQAGIRVADDSSLRWFAESFAYIRMPLFSFLAGLVYAWRPVGLLKDWPSFMTKKVRRLLIPLLVFIPLIGLAQTFVPAANAAPSGSWWQWYASPLPPYWFLFAAFWLFSLVGLLDGLGWLRSKLAALVAILVAGAASLAFVPGGWLYYFLAFGSAVFLLPFFLTGVTISRFGWVNVPKRVQFAAVGVTLTLFVISQYAADPEVGHAPGKHSLIGLLLGVAGCLTILWLGWRNRFVAWIGSFSAGIFLVHPFTVAGTRAVLTRVAGVGSTNGLFVGGLLVGVFGSIVVVMIARRFALGRLALGERSRGVQSGTSWPHRIGWPKFGSAALPVGQHPVTDLPDPGPARRI